MTLFAGLAAGFAGLAAGVVLTLAIEEVSAARRVREVRARRQGLGLTLPIDVGPGVSLDAAERFMRGGPRRPLRSVTGEAGADER